MDGRTRGGCHGARPLFLAGGHRWSGDAHDLRTLSPNETIAHAAEHVLSGFQQDFPVIDQDHVVGILTRGDVLRALASGASSSLVGEVMRRDFTLAEDSEVLTQAMQRLGDGEYRTVPVVRNGVLVGMLPPERIGEVVVLRERTA